MKRIVCLLCCTALALCLAACGAAGNTTGETVEQGRITDVLHLVMDAPMKS